MIDNNVKELAKKLLNTGYDDLPDREQRVLRRMAKRIVISQNVNEQFHEKMSFGERLADQVAAFGGSWTFIIIFGSVLAAWVLVNSWILHSPHSFDPYPYIFLNLILSMLAAIQAPIIMMSQNRQISKDRLAASNDYEINLKAELEIMNLHEKIDDIRTRQLETMLIQQSEQISQLQLLIEKMGAQSKT